MAPTKKSSVDPEEKKLRRKEQNRRAQMNFRQRQDEWIRGLETAVTANQRSGEENTWRLREYIGYLRGLVGTLLADNKVLLQAVRTHPNPAIDFDRVLAGEHLAATGLRPEPDLVGYLAPPVQPHGKQTPAARPQDGSAYPESPPASDGHSPHGVNGMNGLMGAQSITIKSESPFPQYSAPPQQPVAPGPQYYSNSMGSGSNQFGGIPSLVNATQSPYIGAGQPSMSQTFSAPSPSVSSHYAQTPFTEYNNYSAQQSQMALASLMQPMVLSDRPTEPMQSFEQAPSEMLEDPVFSHFNMDDVLFGSLLDVPVPEEQREEGVPSSTERPPINIFSEFASRLLASYGILLDVDPNMDPNGPTLPDPAHVRVADEDMPMLPVMGVPSPVPSPHSSNVEQPEVCIMPATGPADEDVDKLSKCIQALPNVTMREKIKALRKSRFVNVDKLCEDVRALARCHGNPQDVRDWSLPKGFFDRWPVLRGIPVRER